MAETPNGTELDFAAFRRRLEAAREYEFAVGDLRFRLRQPLAIDERVIGCGLDLEQPADQERWLHEVAVHAVIGWEGVQVRHLAPEDKYADLPMPCSGESVRLLLASRLDLNDAIGRELLRRRAEHRERLEDAAKNSASASTGSETGTRRAA